MRIELTINESTMLKGIALLLLLATHLFNPTQLELYDDIQFGNHYLFQELGMGQLCVSMFVLLSGYGLACKPIQFDKGSILSFYRHRLLRLYSAYWFIWLIFVPIGVFVYNYTFADAYGANCVAKFVLDLMGLLSLTGATCYNPTWWFYSCIIPLYLLYPLLYRLMSTQGTVTLLASIAFGVIPFPFTGPFRAFLFAFCSGIWMAQSKPFKIAPPISIIVLLIMFVSHIFKHDNPLYDSYMALPFVWCFCSIKVGKYIQSTLRFIGKHSMNIFLTHTFFLMWLPEYIYYTRNPIISYLTILGLSLCLSIIIETLKKLLCVNKLLRLI